MRKRSNQTIMIDGIDKTWDAIAHEYLGYFSRGWIITIDDISDYLRCTYGYVQRNVAWDIPHIYINRAANKALYRHYKTQWEYGIEDEEDKKYFPLITKKFLFHPDDIRNYFLKSMTLIGMEITENGSVQRKIMQLDELPNVLVSVKDLTNEEGDYYRFKYKELLRRHVVANEIPRVKFKNLVRYRWADISVQNEGSKLS